MHLKNEEETRQAIEKWRVFSTTAQIANLRKAIENTELDQMYYSEKDSARGVARCDACLEMLQDRLAEISDQ